MVSGSLSLPSPGFFSPFPHGTSSLSVAASYLALDRGRPCFRQGFSSLAVLRLRTHEVDTPSGTGFSPSPIGLPMPFPSRVVFSLRELLHVAQVRIFNPPTATACTLHCREFGLFPVRSPLLRESLLMSSPPGTEMVQFPGYRLVRLCIQQTITDSHRLGYPIRPSADLRICAPPRGFSQLVTAFIAVRLL